MSFARLTPRLLTLLLGVLGVLVCAVLAPVTTDAQPTIGSLNSQLSQTRSRAGSLAASVSQLSSLIASLDGQISFVQGREADVQAALASDRASLSEVQASLAAERGRVAALQRRLGRARRALGAQLVSVYENDRPDLVRVVLESSGFTDLLEKLNFLHRAMSQQQALISVTRAAKRAADAATARLGVLQARDQAAAHAAALQAAALAGMNRLLQSRQSALASARAAQAAALGAVRAHGARLQHEIATIQAQQAAAQRAAADNAFSGGPALGPSGGWAIPYQIVLCESGGQNLPPNSAGASGYYQIIPATWKGFGGTGPAAYLASKGEQDAVAARIYRGGAGVSNWSCAAILGIH